MVRMAPVFCASLLVQLAAVAGVTSLTPNSDQEAKQCLMQKTHAVSRSNIFNDGHGGQHVTTKKNHAMPKKRRNTASAAVQKARQHKADKTKVSSGEAHPNEPHKQKTALHSKKKAELLVHKGGNTGGSHRKGQSPKLDKSSKNNKVKAAGLVQLGTHTSNTGRMNPALELLPKPVLELASKLFKDENAIAGCIENSVLVDVTYAGVKMSLRMNKFDDATKRTGEEAQWFGYDLDTLGDVVDGSHEMLNMLDVGGNYGVVTIAAMKKYAKTLRVIVVEPIPEIFFFLVWNLYINEIPVLGEAAMKDEKYVPGVLALNSGSGDVVEDLHFCAYPWSSMNSKVCDCKPEQDNCHIVPSITVDRLVGMFASDPIAMVKMDCEGCEFKSLPALAKKKLAKRVRRLAGELHLPDRSLEELACRWENGRLMSKCQQGKNGKDDVECGVKLAC